MPNIQYCGSKSEASIMLAFNVHKQNCTHKLRVTEHVQNKCETDSGNCLHKDHRGLSTAFNLNSLSFKYRVLFNVLYCKNRNDDAIVFAPGSRYTLLQSTSSSRSILDLCAVGGVTTCFNSSWYANL